MVALSLGAATGRAADTDAEVTAHQSVLDLAGAFTNDGFKLRDGNYKGTLKAGESVLVQVNLYAGNQYWFSVAAAEPKSSVSINVYDESGKLMNSEAFTTTTAPATGATPALQPSADPYANKNRAAAGFAPDTSGPYYVRITETAGDAATFCLIYSYK
jgi:hypothetical protein